MSHYTGWLPHFILPTDIATLQTQLLNAATALNTTITTNCPALQGTQQTSGTNTNPQATLAGWQAFYASIQQYAAVSSEIYWIAPGGGTFYDQGQEYAGELAAWQAMVATPSMCNFPLPNYNFNPNEPTPPDPTATTILSTIRWVSAAVGAVAVAYAVSEIAMPLMAARAATPRKAATSPRPRADRQR